MPTLTRRALPWLAAALLVPLAGCGGSSGNAAASTGDTTAAVSGGDGDGSGGGGGRAGACAKGALGPTVCFSYDITGATTAKGTVAGLTATGNGTSYESCADWVKGEPDGDDGRPSLHMPSGGATQPGDDFGGLTGNVIEHYTGPGTYQMKDLSGEGSPAGVILPKAPVTYVLQEDSTGTATINADGSGNFTFTDLGTGQYGHDEKVSGSVTWTCHNP
ncbi:MAG TPA: hypothetical protein VLM05_13530 [Mycobacteriales bacterium]|nr:hypothetical protein [Mycobacteriales bacterium]